MQNVGLLIAEWVKSFRSLRISEFWVHHFLCAAFEISKLHRTSHTYDPIHYLKWLSYRAKYVWNFKRMPKCQQSEKRKWKKKIINEISHDTRSERILNEKAAKKNIAWIRKMLCQRLCGFDGRYLYVYMNRTKAHFRIIFGSQLMQQTNE